jgi:hypothetical protein
MRALRNGGRAVSMPLPDTPGVNRKRGDGSGKVASLIHMYEQLGVS